MPRQTGSGANSDAPCQPWVPVSAKPASVGVPHRPRSRLGGQATFPGGLSVASVRIEMALPDTRGGMVHPLQETLRILEAFNLTGSFPLSPTLTAGGAESGFEGGREGLG